jgi:arsenite-transporting ATPase
MALNRLLFDESLQLIVFGGKGGVGKTTIAAATALEQAKEKKVLICSTGRISSLADSFGQTIGHEPTAITGASNLFAIEIDAQKVLKDFKKAYGGDILDVLQQGTYLSDKEIEEMFSLDLPGMEEVMIVKKVADLIEKADYQVYIVDTAPTSRTLRLLMLPNLLDNWIKFLASLRWRHNVVLKAFAGGKRLEKADTFLLGMKKSVNKMRALLQSFGKTEFVVVTIPEQMAVVEAEDLLRNLERMHIPSRHIIINCMFPQEAPAFTELGEIMRTSLSRTEDIPPAFPFFGSDLNLEGYLDFAEIRRKTQEKYFREIKEKFGTRDITEVFWQPTEIRGIDSLRMLGSYLFAR